jgi:hypothetical protein
MRDPTVQGGFRLQEPPMSKGKRSARGGRPRGSGDGLTVLLAFRVAPHVAREIDAKGRTRSLMLRDLLTRWADRQRRARARKRTRTRAMTAARPGEDGARP